MKKNIIKKITSMILCFSTIFVFSFPVYAVGNENDEYSYYSAYEDGGYSYSKYNISYVFNCRITADGDVLFGYNDHGHISEGQAHINDFPGKTQEEIALLLQNETDKYSQKQYEAPSASNSYIETRGYDTLKDAYQSVFKGAPYGPRTIYNTAFSEGSNKWTVKILEDHQIEEQAFWAGMLEEGLTKSTVLLILGVPIFNWEYLKDLLDWVPDLAREWVLSGTFYLEKVFINSTMTRTGFCEGKGTFFSGWDRTLLFAKADSSIGWTHDSSYNHNIKDTSFDNLKEIAQITWENYM